MSIAIIVSLQRNLKHQKKKKTEHPCPIIWIPHSIPYIWKDASTNGVCRGSSQGAGNIPSVVHAANWSPTTKWHKQIQHSSVLWGTLNKSWKMIVQTPTRTLVCRFRCATYITNVVRIRMQAAVTNVPSKYLCQTPNMRGSISKGRAIMSSSLTSSFEKSLQKEY